VLRQLLLFKREVLASTFCVSWSSIRSIAAEEGSVLADYLSTDFYDVVGDISIKRV